MNFFSDKTFVFTGELTLQRDYAKSKIILLGGRVTTAISRKTDYLVAGEEPGPKKVEKATEYNIKILDEHKFTALLEEALKSIDKSTNVEVSAGMTVEDNQISSDFDENHLFDSYGEKPSDSNKDDKEHDNNRGNNHDKEHDNKDVTSWSEKYRPKNLQEIVGNRTVINSLSEFIQGKTKYKGALLSGAPGIGKTTSVHLVCNELGYKLVEFNASDVRNKTLLTKKVRGVLNTMGFSKDLKFRKKILLMDEVDGMTSDRGGLTELNDIIKNSNLPVVCICNDVNNLKLRTLKNNCLELKYKKPDDKQILQRLNTILESENKKISNEILNAIISASHGDIRYILNTVQRICFRQKINPGANSLLYNKVVSKNIFEAAQECFKKKSIKEKTDLYFVDYSMIPLFIAENYMKLNFKNIKEMYNSSESISQGDVIDQLIHGSTQEWILAPLHAFCSIILPTKDKVMYKPIYFPGFLGQNSKRLKQQKIIKEVLSHTYKHLRSDMTSFRMYEVNVIFLQFIECLKNNNIDGAINILQSCDLLKTDIINLSEIYINGQDMYKEIKSKVKSELTKQYNKLKRKLPYVLEEEKKTAAHINSSEEEE